MKQTLTYLVAGALALAAAACSKEQESAQENTLTLGPVVLSATVEDNDVKATITEETGAFAFSANDQILVWNGTKGYWGTTSMDSRFASSDKSFAVYPPSAASYMTQEYVTIHYPMMYSFNEVGTTGDPNLCPTPCPMIAYYNGDGKLNFRHVGALVRFRLTNTALTSETLPEDITFTFTTPVAGDANLYKVPTSADEGIHGKDLTEASYSITVRSVPKTNASKGEYVYITLPVPVGTDPGHVGIFHQYTGDRRVSTTVNKAESVSLKRADGYKVGASFELDPLSEFGGCKIAGYLHYGPHPHKTGVVGFEVLPYNYWGDYFKNGASGKAAYYFSRHNLSQGTSLDNGLNLNEGANVRFGDNGSYFVRIPTGAGGEWSKMLGTERPGAIVNGKRAHYAYVTYRDGDKSYYGLMLFPDNAVIATDIASYDNTKKIHLTKFDTHCPLYTGVGDDANCIYARVGYRASEMTMLTEQGCFFLPAGFADSYDENNNFQNDGYYYKGATGEGRYWSVSELLGDYQRLYIMNFKDADGDTPSDTNYVEDAGGSFCAAVVILAK